jgi:hypothetical protein
MGLRGLPAPLLPPPWRVVPLGIRRHGDTSSPSPRSPCWMLGVAPSRAAVMVARARSTPTRRRHCGGRPICTSLPARPRMSTIRLRQTGSVSPGVRLQPRQASPHCAAGSLLVPTPPTDGNCRALPGGIRRYGPSRKPSPLPGGHRYGLQPLSHHLPGGIRSAPAWAHHSSAHPPYVSLSHLRARVEEER